LGAMIDGWKTKMSNSAEEGSESGKDLDTLGLKQVYPEPWLAAEFCAAKHVRH
jgi:hypothetical protein